MGMKQTHSAAARYAREQGELAAQKATELEERVNTAIADTTDSAEVIDARKGFVNLRERLDTEIGEVAQQLAQNTQTIEDRFVNVKSPPAPLVGAKGDGVTDDLGAFLGVLNYLKTKGGGTLFVPHVETFYAVSDSLEADETYGVINIIGNGRMSHIKLTQKSTRGHLFAFFGSAETEDKWVNGGSIKDIALSTYEGTTLEDDNPLGITSAKNIIAENVYIPYSNWKGITIQRFARNIKIINCETEKCRKGGVVVEFSSVSDVEIINLSTHDNLENGVLITNADDPQLIKGIKLKNVTSYNNGNNGVSLSGVDNPEIDVVTFGNKWHGIHFYNSNFGRAKGLVYNNDLAGVRFQGGKGHTFSGTSRNNSLNDPLTRGNIFIESTPNTKIIDADISEGLRAYTNWSENTSFVNVKTEGATNFPSETDLARFTSGLRIGRERGIYFVNGKPTVGNFIMGSLCIETNPASGKPSLYQVTATGKAHKDSVGTLTSGSTTITDVTNIDTWKVGDIIKAPGIPFGTTITAVGSTTLTISVAPTSSGSQALYDAKFESFLIIP